MFSSIQIKPQGPYWTQGPVFFELSVYNGSQSRNSHRSHTSLASWFLVMKSEEGNKVAFSHWPRLDTLFATQA